MLALLPQSFPSSCAPVYSGDRLREHALPLLLLSRLALSAERSGLELALEAERFVELPGMMGIVLPMLAGMEHKGLLLSRWIKINNGPGGGVRKLYRLTEHGSSMYQAGVRDIESILLELRSHEPVGDRKKND